MVAFVPDHVLEQEDRVVVVKVHVPDCLHPAFYRVPHRLGAVFQHLRHAAGWCCCGPRSPAEPQASLGLVRPAYLVSISRVGLSLVPFLISIFNPEPKMPMHSSTSAWASLLLLSGPPFFATLRGTEHLVPRSLRLQSPVRGDLRAKVRRFQHRCFLRGGLA